MQCAVIDLASEEKSRDIKQQCEINQIDECGLLSQHIGELDSTEFDEQK